MELRVVAITWHEIRGLYCLTTLGN